MSYISREEVLKVLNSYIDEEYPDPTSGATLNMIDEIKALPSIPENSQIRELIEKKLEDLEDLKELRGLYDGEWELHGLLQELLSEIEPGLSSR